MSYLLKKLSSKQEVDDVIRSTEDLVLVLRFGRDSDLTCMQLDEIVSCYRPFFWLTVYFNCILQSSQVPKSQIHRLQQIQNSLVRAIVKAPEFMHSTPILKSLHWLKITERIEYKLVYLTFKLLYTMQPPYLYDLISLQTPHSTRSSSVVTLACPPTDCNHRQNMQFKVFSNFHWQIFVLEVG